LTIELEQGLVLLFTLIRPDARSISSLHSFEFAHKKALESSQGQIQELVVWYAVKRTRTSTVLLPLAPEASASANSAMTA
jgi:hypothetical protein